MKNVLLGTGLVALAAALFGTQGALARGADAAGIGAIPLVAWRAGVAVLFLLGAGVIVGGRGRHSRVPSLRVLRRDRRIALIVASLCGAAINIALFAAFLQTSVAVVLICFYTFPAIVTVASVPLNGERLSPVRIGALLLSLTGLGFVLLPSLAGMGGVAIDPLGVVLALSAAIAQTAVVLIASRGFHPMPSVHVATVVVMTAAAIAVPVALLVGSGPNLLAPLNQPDLWSWILVAGIFAAAIPTLAFVAGVALIAASRAAILMTIEPLVGVTLAALLLGEQPSAPQFVGGVAVVAAAAILQVAPARSPALPEPGPGSLV